MKLFLKPQGLDARVLKSHIPLRKIADPYCVLFKLCPFLELYHFYKNEMTVL